MNNKENFCPVPFTHLYYFTDGFVYPCPALASNEKYRLGKVTDNIETLWNSEILKNMRLKMADNKPIKECVLECNASLNSCKKYLGDDSLVSASKNLLSLSADGSTELNFSIWNLIESNKCNLKCTYCNSKYSSSWVYDEKAVFNGRSGINNGLDYNSIISLYDKNYDNLEEIWLAGGEPTIQPSTYYFLNKLKKDNKQVRIRYITNLMFNSFKGENIFDLLSFFNDVKIFGSWDLDGERGEYIRTNSKSHIIKNHIKEINDKKICFYLQSVMSIFNVYYYPDFHKRLFNEGLVRKDNVRYYNLNYPEVFRYSILKESVKQEIEKNILEYKKWIQEDNISDFYANKEHPCITLDKIIESMKTGKWGHWDYSDEKNASLRFELVKRLTKLDLHRHKKIIFTSLFKEIF